MNALTLGYYILLVIISTTLGIHYMAFITYFFPPCWIMWILDKIGLISNSCTDYVYTYKSYIVPILIVSAVVIQKLFMIDVLFETFNVYTSITDVVFMAVIGLITTLVIETINKNSRSDNPDQSETDLEKYDSYISSGIMIAFILFYYVIKRR